MLLLVISLRNFFQSLLAKQESERQALAEVDRLQRAVQSDNDRIRQAQQAATAARRLYDTKQSQLSECRQRQEHLQKSLERSRADESKRSTRVQQQQSRVEALETQLAEAQRRLSEFQSEEQRSAAVGQRMTLDQRRRWNEAKDAMQSSLLELSSRQVSLRRELARAQAALDVSQSGGSMPRARLQQIQQQLQSERNQLVAARARSEQVDAQLKALQAKLGDDRRDVQISRHELTAVQQELIQIDSQLSEQQSSMHETQQSLQKRQMLATLQSQFGGERVRGRLVDLVKPKASRFSLALSLICGRHLDEIVVDTRETAQQCIQFLRQQKLGTLTFLPMDSLRTKPCQFSFGMTSFLAHRDISRVVCFFFF